MTENAIVTVAVNLTPQQMASLAREVAMDIRELSAILGDYRITETQYDTLKENSFFKKALEASVIEWNSALSTHQRIKLQAAASLEQALPILGARMMKSDEDLNKAVETGKLLTKIAGIGEDRKDGVPGEKFTITINLGADQQLTIEKDKAPKVIDHEPTEIS